VRKPIHGRGWGRIAARREDIHGEVEQALDIHSRVEQRLAWAARGRPNGRTSVAHSPWFRYTPQEFHPVSRTRGFIFGLRIRRGRSNV